jgi:hypothetical protein
MAVHYVRIDMLPMSTFIRFKQLYVLSGSYDTRFFHLNYKMIFSDSFPLQKTLLKTGYCPSFPKYFIFYTHMSIKTSIVILFPQTKLDFYENEAEITRFMLLL